MFFFFSFSIIFITVFSFTVIKKMSQSDSPNIATPVVIDTHPDEENLKNVGLSIEWMNKELADRGLALCDIFLMTVNENTVINIIEKEKKK